MKDYSYKKHRVVFLRETGKYTASSNGNSLTEDLLQANHWYMDVPTASILEYLRPDLRQEAEILEIIVAAMTL